MPVVAVPEDIPDKGTRPYVPGGFTGGGGGGPGGGSFGFGGGGLGVPYAPGGMRGGFGLFQQADRRRRGMPAVPGVTPGAPQPSDTVPAMLTPGEIVMNNGVTSDPQLAEALTHLNMMGAQRMMQPQGFAFGGLAQGAPQRFMGFPGMQGGFPAGGMGGFRGGAPTGGFGGGAPMGAPVNGFGGGRQMAAPGGVNGFGGGAPAGGNVNGFGGGASAGGNVNGYGHGAPTGGNVNGYGGGTPIAAGRAWGPQAGAPPAGPAGYKPMGGATPPVYGPAAGMAYGGVVPGYAFGGEVLDGYAYGGHVNPFLMALRYMNMPAGYAMGGTVFGRAQQAMSNMMGGRASGRPNAGPAGAAPSGGQIPGSAPGYYTPNGSWSGVDPTSEQSRKEGVWSDNSGNVRNREGNLLSFDPRNPYAVMSQSYDPTARGVGMRQLGAFGEAGYWDPNGNQALMNSVRGEALANARAAQQGAGLRAQLAGMDPGAAASYRMEAGLRGSSDVARALNNARTQSMLAQQNYANSLAGNLISNQNQQFTMENQTRNQDLLNNNQHQRENSGGIGGALGSIVGQGLGAFTGGYGQSLGQRMGR